MLYRCRCSRRNCQARRTFKKHPEQYVRTPKCHCGSRSWYVDWFRMKREQTRTCTCTGYHFPHREGSLRCHENPMAEYVWLKDRGMETEEDLLRCLNSWLRLLASLGREG